MDVAANGLSPLRRAYLAIEQLQSRLEQVEGALREPIAIVGMGLRFPGGVDTPEKYWDLLLSGEDAITEVPPERFDIDAYYDPDPDAPGKIASRYGAFLRDVDQFDAGFFGIAPREAAALDPQQRLLLETSWEALERAGIAPDRLDGSPTGVFFGLTTTDYREVQRDAVGLEGLDQYYASGYAHSVAAGRVAYLLGLTGPALALDTACSSSLVAVHLAVQSLRRGECDLALAGGVNLILAPESSIALSRYHMLAPDGRCKFGDEAADGFVRGEGCGVVALKRLSDAVAADDPIVAVIRGSAANQDGRSNGLTAPSGAAQRAVIGAALADAGLAAGQVGYVEAHGTGTALGDPVELHALAAALGTDRAPDRPLLVGSAKTTIGHTEAAAGIAGLLRAALAANRGLVPPGRPPQRLTGRVAWESLPLVLPTAATPWPSDGAGGPGAAGVSAFGFAGTNAHLILTPPPSIAHQNEATPTDPRAARERHLLILSAKSEAGLRAVAGRWAAWLGGVPGVPVAAAAAVAATGRARLAHRLALPVAAGGAAGAASALAAYAAGGRAAGLAAGVAPAGAAGRPVFLFTGQGGLVAGAGRGLYAAEPAFRAALDACAALLAPHLDRPLLDVLFAAAGTPEAALLGRAAWAQPALVALEWALYALWRSWGVAPAAVAGHSLGEYAAAAAAGVLDLGAALGLAAARGRLVDTLPGGGAMAALLVPEAEARAALAAVAARAAADPALGHAEVAAVNGPAHTVVSGDAAAVGAAVARIRAAGGRATPLATTHAFHSRRMDPLRDPFARELATVTFRPPQIRLYSNLSGAPAGPEIRTPDYWSRHLREPVLFGATIEAMRAQGYDLFLEIGPHPILSGIGRESPGGETATWLPSLRQKRDDHATIFDTLGQLYLKGLPINWEEVYGPVSRRHVALPTYPFQRQRHWVEPKKRRPALTAPAEGNRHPLLGRQLRSALRERQYEAELAADDLAYLRDHQVFGQTYLPAAGFIETSLAAAAASGGRALADLLIHAPLTFAGDEHRMVQTIVRPGDDGATVCVFSQGAAGDEWLLHTTAQITASADDRANSTLDLDAIRARCTERVDPEAHYEGLRQRGIALGPALQGVAALWRNGAEALGEIILPTAEAAAAAAYTIHPALLDAAVQVLGAAVPDVDGTFLPIALDSVRRYADPGDHAWSYVRLLQPIGNNGAGQGTTLTADVTICDASGNAVLELRGLGLKRAEGGAAEALNDLFYEVQWHSAKRAIGQPAPQQLAVSAQALVDDDRAGRGDLASLRILNAQLDPLCADYIALALDRLGWRPQPGEVVDAAALADRLGVVARHRRLFARFLAILAEDGYLQTVAGGFVVARPWPVEEPAALDLRRRTLLEQFPGFAAELTFIERCGPALAEALRGATDPLQLLFPDGDTTTAERLYTDSPVAGVFNRLIQATVAAAVAARPDGPLRVLEIGGGTGGTTAGLLATLPAARTEYTFTDISPTFVAKAAEKFSPYPFVTYRPVDIEREPLAQGLVAAQYDIVLAVNVLHATRDLRQTLAHIARVLAPGGLLLVVEGTTPQRWVDLSFGLTDGWWRFTDTDVRPAYPMIDRAAWFDLLTAAGFEVTAVPDAATTPVEQILLIARGPRAIASPATGRDWLIFADDGGVGAALATALVARGDRPLVVKRGATFARGADWAQIDPHNPADFSRLLREAATPAHVAGTVYLWGLDSDTAAHDDSPARAGERALAGALHAVQALVGVGCTGRLWLVTRGAQPAGEAGVVDPGQGLLWGLGKTIALEYPELRPTRIDLDPDAPPPATELLDELLNGDDEDQIALRGNERLAARLARLVPRDVAADEEVREVELTFAARGTLDNLTVRPLQRRPPGPGEVEIRVHAAGLNFKDVLNVLGMYPGDPGPLGGECAGTIVAVGAGVADLHPGDEVIALVGGSFRSFVTAPADFVVPRPAGLSFPAAATTAIAYTTAAVALQELGRLRPGERVLIHAGAGGVGLAAIHLARASGAIVYATAGSVAKRAHLRALGVAGVYDSRTVAFAEQLRADTAGEGVDLVLNSLAGEAIPASLGLLRRGGRFLELGKRDHLSGDASARLDQSLTYHVIDWGETAREDPALIRSILREMVTQVADGRLPALPVRAFPLADATAAFQYMARARHIGKIAITFPNLDGELVRGDGAYLITGGLRGLGLALAEHLAAAGARHLLLLGRRAPDDTARAAIAELETAGVRVLVQQGDVSCRDDVAAALTTIDRAGLPLRGVFHCAGVLDDGALAQQTWARFRRVLDPKVRGAWWLHQLTADRPLDHFVLFSSVAAVLGSPGQGNHAAANAFLDALAQQRRAVGLPALSVNWGAWAEIGAAVAGGRTTTANEEILVPIAPARALAALDRLLRGERCQVAVAAIRWPRFLERRAATTPFFSQVRPICAPSGPEAPPPTNDNDDLRAVLAATSPGLRRERLLDFVQVQAGAVLGLPAAQVDPFASFSELGLDSLMAVELRNRLSQGLALAQPLAATLVFEYPNAAAITEHLATTALAEFFAAAHASRAEVATPSPVEGGLVTALLDSLDSLSDEEVARLLAVKSVRGGAGD